MKQIYQTPAAALLPAGEDLIRTSDPYEGELDPANLNK